MMTESNKLHLLMTYRHQQQQQHRQGREPKKRLFCSASASAAQQRRNVRSLSVDGQIERRIAETAGRRVSVEDENKTSHTKQNQQHILNINAHLSVAFTSALQAISS
jgi:hypothetical protein